MAYIIQLIVLHDIDVLTIQDTPLSTIQGSYYAEWSKDLTGPGPWAKAFNTTSPTRNATAPAHTGRAEMGYQSAANLTR